jgi:hypothetical protein
VKNWKKIPWAILIFTLVLGGALFLHKNSTSYWWEAREKCMDAGYPRMEVILTYEGKQAYCVNAMEAVRVEEVE